MHSSYWQVGYAITCCTMTNTCKIGGHILIGTDTGVYIKALEDTHVNLLFESDFPVEQLNVLYSANMLIVKTGKSITMISMTN